LFAGGVHASVAALGYDAKKGIVGTSVAVEVEHNGVGLSICRCSESEHKRREAEVEAIRRKVLAVVIVSSFTGVDAHGGGGDVPPDQGWADRF
jgi:hypothetical protein